MFHVTSYSKLNSNMHVDKLVLCVCILCLLSHVVVHGVCKRLHGGVM